MYITQPIQAKNSIESVEQTIKNRVDYIHKTLTSNSYEDSVGLLGGGKRRGIM